MRQVFPDARLVELACRGLWVDEHPVLDAAGELAILHITPQCRMRLGKVDGHRRRLIRSIDRWVITAAPVPYPAAPSATETVGTVVDRLASWCVTASRCQDRPAGDLAIAQQQVSNLLGEYDALITAVAAAVVVLPLTTQLPRTGFAWSPVLVSRCRS